VTYARIWSAMRAQLEGPLSVALERAAQVTADPRAEWAPQSIPYMTAQQLWWLMLLGGQAERILLGAQSFAASQTRVPEGNAMLPRLYAECGRLEEARGMLGPPMRRRHGFGSGELWLFMAAIQAETCVLVGDRERAADLFASLQPYAGRMLSAVPVCVGPLARPLGSIAALLERWAEAERYFEQAAAEARGFRAPVLSALVDVERACAFRAHPDPGERRANAELHASAGAPPAPSGWRDWSRGSPAPESTVQRGLRVVQDLPASPGQDRANPRGRRGVSDPPSIWPPARTFR
jgi:hypothetical protein